MDFEFSFLPAVFISLKNVYPVHVTGITVSSLQAKTKSAIRLAKYYIHRQHTKKPLVKNKGKRTPAIKLADVAFYFPSEIRVLATSFRSAPLCADVREKLTGT